MTATQNYLTQQVEQSMGPLGNPEPPLPLPEPDETSDEVLSADDKRLCIDNNSRKMARYINDLQRQNHASPVADQPSAR